MLALSTMPDLSGRLVNEGKYQLIKPLGSGACGVVYKAINLDLSRRSLRIPVRLAIKCLRKESMSPSAAKRVRREVAFHFKMSRHPSVVTMYDAFEDADYVYIVMDYCPGGDLFSKIVDEKLYFGKDQLTRSVFLQILDVVDACHQRGIYHRDLKPENILTSPNGTRVYLSDFGLSTKTRVSEVFGCGTQYYMSPECIGKETGSTPFSNRASDVWSLGIILINLISGRSPWSKALTSDDCFCQFVLNENYLRDMLPISEGANTILRQMLAYDPSERITIRALRTAIRNLDTFFMTNDEIARASDAVRLAASYCGVHIEPGQAEVVTTAHVVAAEARSEEAQDTEYDSSSSASSDSDTGSSATESDGPVTPSSYAQDPELEVPELKLQLSGFGQPALKHRADRDLPTLLQVEVKVQVCVEVTEVAWCG